MDERLGRLFELVDSARDELVEFHQSIVRVPTVNTGVMPTGNETPCAEVVKAKLADAGIPANIYESAPARGNLIARLAGSAGTPALHYMSHLDVVPIEDESKWTHPPFGAEIHDGKIWGRGSSDAKSCVSTSVMAMILLKRSGLPLKGDLVFSAGADEETGGQYGYGWLAKHRADELRADWALNEGGGAATRTSRGLYYTFCTGEKGRLEVVFHISGRSGHANRGWTPENALVKAGEIIHRLGAWQPEIDTSYPLFDHLEELAGVRDKPTPANLDRIIEAISQQQPGLASMLRGMSRMTFTPTMLTSGIKSNSIPASARLTCDVRTLPYQGLDYVHRQAEQLASGIPGVEIEVIYTAQPNESPFGTPFTDLARRATELAVGEPVKLLPALSIGFTDSRFIRPIGTQVYGFMPSAPDQDPDHGVHGVDERIEIETLVLRTRALVALAAMALGG